MGVGSERVQVKVEPGRALDALPSLALHREVLAEDRFFVTRAEEFTHTLELREREIAECERRDNAAFLVARLPEVRLAGFLVATGGSLARGRHVARVEMMVAPGCRRRGVGRALLDGAIRWAEGTGVVRKLSLAVFADNAAAIALYRSVGFVDEGRRIGEYREPDGRLRGDLLLAKFVGSSASP
ncbi:MAG: N-acetyltransferase [Myxococcota bacterium]